MLNNKIRHWPSVVKTVISASFFITFITVFALINSYYTSIYATWLSASLEKETALIFPWRGDAQCEDLSIKFVLPPNKLKRASLASFPGSGNTWIRGLVERLTGVFTGSFYNDKDLYVKGFYGELEKPDCNCTVLQKTHNFWNLGENILLIIRNPYSALISFRNYCVAPGSNHVQSGSGAHFSGPDWDSFVSRSIGKWRNLTMHGINNLQTGGVIHYENLVHHREAELRKMSAYLKGLQPGLVEELNNERRFNCTLKNDFRAFKRSGSESPKRRETKDPFSSEQKKVMDFAIKEVHALLVQKGYDPIPFQYYNNNRSR